MANNIVLKTYKGGNVTPQDDAIIQETAIPMNGIFKGCEVSHARGNVLRVSQGFGMIKGRFFEVYESEIAVQLANAGQTLDGRIYIHMDLSNMDEPVMLLSATGENLPDLDMDADVNYNNSTYDLELAAFLVSSSGIDNLTQTFSRLTGGAGGSGSGNTLVRDTEYEAGDTALVSAAPGWVTLVCTQAGKTALAEPTSYATIQSVGDSILDGTCVFTARDIIGELDGALAALKKVDSLSKQVEELLNSDGSLSTKMISLTDYKALESYDEDCIYLCFEDENTKKIKRIYLGENKIFAEGVKVTFQTDTEEMETIHVDDGEDALILAPKAVREGYTFTGWRKDTLADGKVLTSCVAEEESDFTLYAVFQKEIEVNMYPNGATLIDGKSESIIKTICYYNNGNLLGAKVSVPECPYEKKEVSFAGWNCRGMLYKPGEKACFIDGDFITPEWVDTVYDFPYTGSYVPFTIPADGIYEFEVWGAEGSSATKNDVVGKGGLGGHAKGYKKMTKGQTIYVFNGGMPVSSSDDGKNGGGYGCTYSSNNGIGAGGGGATSITTRSGPLGTSNTSTQSSNYNKREEEILIVAGGGGGGGITNAGVANKGGDGGGERGGDGSSGVLGGRQISTGNTPYTNFGCAPSSAGSNTTYSGGGGGYFGGSYGYKGESGSGGSGYVGGVAAFTFNKKFYGTVNEAGVNEGNGYAYIRYVECV